MRRPVEGRLVSLMLEDSHDLDAVHRLRPGRVVVEHTEQESVRGSDGANRRPEGRIIRPGLG